MKNLTYAAIGLVIFAGAVGVSNVRVVNEAHADCTSIWATCSESDTSELSAELDNPDKED